MKNQKLKSKRAFSIIELIFVIAVLGLIIGVAVPKFLNTKTAAEATTIQQDIVTITTAIQTHYMLNNSGDTISEIVNINEKRWTDNNNEIIYKDGDSDCVTIKIDNKQLKVDISGSGAKCTKLAELGIVDATYELF